MPANPLGPELVAFLDDLSRNNDRDWFKAHQARYEADVREPVRAFVRAMEPVLAEHAPFLVADDRKVGGSMMRPQRDTRFSKDKKPYKTNVGIQLRHVAGRDVHAPGLYLHIHPSEVFVGLGMYRPSSPDLAAIRARIDATPDAFRELVTDPALTAVWRIGQMDALKRSPRGYAADHPMAEWLRLKSHILLCDLPTEALFTDDLPGRLASMLDAGRGYCSFLCDAIGQDW